MIFANVSRAQTIWGAVEPSSKVFDYADVGACGKLRVITSLEFLQHHFSQMGHRDTSCDPHLHQSHQATNAPIPHANRLPPGGCVQTRFSETAIRRNLPPELSTCTSWCSLVRKGWIAVGMRRMVYFLLGGGILFAILAGLLAITTKSLDLYIRDRYFLILPTRLLFVSALLVLTALAIWQRKISR